MAKLCTIFRLNANWKLKTLVILMLFDFTLEAQVHLWSKNFGDYATVLKRDHEDNLYIVGNYSSVVDLDPGPGLLQAPFNDGTDIFLVKLDRSGRLIWAKNWGGNSYDNVNGVAIDNSGNVYITGEFKNTVDFDPGPDTLNLVASPYTNVFILKLDRDGNLQWVNSFGNGTTTSGQGITVDPQGNVITTGNFDGTVDFDPGPGSFHLAPNGDTSRYDVFIVKLDPSGAFIWAKNVGGAVSDFSRAVEVDLDGNIYASGAYGPPGDFDPGPGTFLLTGISHDIYLLKLDSDGNFIWARSMGGSGQDDVNSIALDAAGNVYTTGIFSNTADFDPGTEIYNLTVSSLFDAYLSKLDSDGNFVWAKRIGNTGYDRGQTVTVDPIGNVYWGGSFDFQADMDPGVNVYTLDGQGGHDGFIIRLDQAGNFVWAQTFGSQQHDVITCSILNSAGQLCIAGSFNSVIDFDPNEGTAELTAVDGSNVFIAVYSERGVIGSVFNDINENCIQAGNEIGLAGRRVMIQPGDWIAETNNGGAWYIDSLPPGNYTLTLDSTNEWTPTCSPPFSFSVITGQELTLAPDVGLVNEDPCASPAISVTIPWLRRCFSNPLMAIAACNLSTATGQLNNAYVIVTLDSLISITSANYPYTEIAEDEYRFDVGDLNPGECVDIRIATELDCDAVLGQTLCVEAKIFPVPPCLYGPGETLTTPGLPPCAYEEDHSNVILDGWCQQDTLIFTITNNSAAGTGDMKCYAPVRLFLDGVLILKDSVRLVGGESDTLRYAGDGRTWRLEVDQHPGHINRSHPNITLERCGPVVNWTPDLFNAMSLDDDGHEIDIACPLVQGSFDPNDKTGYPTGLHQEHKILPNRQLDYTIRFQNTGNDTAFFVIIRDTLDIDVNVFSVRTGAASHDYTFKMYGQRVLEWTFENILLPDSATNLEGSNGYVSFSVDQVPDLPDGATITNDAGIYFDFNDPVQTNTTLHTVDRQAFLPTWSVMKEVDLAACHDIEVNDIQYTQSGTYWQVVDGGTDTDTLLKVNLLIPAAGWTNVMLIDTILTSAAINAGYQWMDCNTSQPVQGAISATFNPGSPGEYAVIVSQYGCVDTSACINYDIVGLSSMADHSLLVFPNPTAGMVNIRLAEKIPHGTLQVLDVYGNVCSIQLVEDEQYLTVPLDVPAGIYFILIATNAKTMVRRVVRH